MKNKLINKVDTYLYPFVLIIFLLFGNYSLTLAQSNPTTIADNARKMIDRYYFNQDFQISVNKQDELNISGTVNTLFDKLRVRELLSRVPGVKKINSQISISASTLPDMEIQDNIINELKYNSSILEPDKIKVNVQNGVVTLSGEVNYYHEKEMVQSIASWQAGVKNMISNIKVLPPAIAKSDENLDEIISDVLKDRFPLEKNIAVDVNNGVVTVSGSVNNLWAKEHVTDELLQIVGVKSVNNNLIIIPPEEI